MQRIPLRSKKGCIRCRERRRKCDEVRPICGDCLRMGCSCRWRAADQMNDGAPSGKRFLTWKVEAVNDVSIHCEIGQRKAPSNSSELVTLKRRQTSFDHPALLPSSPFSVVDDPGGKHALQYLWEQGHSILRYPTQRYPANMTINSFRSGFLMASNAPIQREAYLCLGAASLSQLHPQYEKVALKHYSAVILALRSAIRRCEHTPPAEWTCAVAAILSRYEMVVFNSSESRIAHLLGFHRLVEARIAWQQPWGPTRMLLEHYVHSLSDNCLFHHQVLVGEKPIDYLDQVMQTLNEKYRPLGREIVGVPEDLTTIVYKLAFLNLKDISRPPWDMELVAVTALLEAWKPPSHALIPSASTLLLIGKLYHLASTCLMYNIWNRSVDAYDKRVANCLEEASMLVQKSDLRKQPFNSAAWPLVILGIFAVEAIHRLIFRQPLESLVVNAKLKGYNTALAFLSHISNKELGPKVLQMHDLLSIVHI